MSESLERQIARVNLYNRLVQEHLTRMYPEGVPYKGSKLQVLDLQVAVFADPEWRRFNLEKEEEEER